MTLAELILGAVILVIGIPAVVLAYLTIKNVKL